MTETTTSLPGVARIFGALFLLTVFSSPALSASDFAPDNILSAHISLTVTSASDAEDLGSDTLAFTSADISSGAYQYVKLSANTARVTYDDGEYHGTIAVTFNSASSGTFRDDYSGASSGFTSGTFEIMEWNADFGGDTWFAGASELPDGWRYLNWFKGFKPTDRDWIFHGRHGWLYVVGNSPSGLFLWDTAMERWLWTNENVYPWLYAYGAGEGWVFFFEGGRPGSRYFKRGDTGEVVSEGQLGL